MVLIIGGAWQGKLDFAKNAFGFTDGDVFPCAGAQIDFSKACIDRLEEFTFACIRQGVDPIAYFEENKELWKDSVLICGDFSCGVVPLEVENRKWRQSTGRLCQYLAKEARQVSRIFCGLEQRLK